MLKTIISFSLIILSLINVSCRSNNSNRDYWSINEPQIFAWDTSSEANQRGFNTLVSEFSSDQITESLGYESHLVFRNRETVVSLEVKATCLNPETRQVFNSTKTTQIPVSLKVYIYNFIPNEVLYDQIDQISSQNHNCNFEFIAKNTIDSEHSFTLRDIKINTSSRNEINILAVERNGNGRPRTIRPNNRDTIAQRSSVYFNDPDNYFIFDKTIQRGLLTAPGVIKCLGTNNSFNLESRNNQLQNSLADAFINTANEGNTTFLKKCRIVTQLNLDARYSMESTHSDHELRTVWSEYFNVIFDHPSVELQISQVEAATGTAYPFNLSDYVDLGTHIYDLTFINTSRHPIQINLPSQERLKAILSPLIFSAQRSNFRPINSFNNWGGLNIYELRQDFETELQFMSNGQRVTTLMINQDSSYTVNLVLDKNFSCTFTSALESTVNSNAERGFRIRAIDLGSSQDQISIDYMNQNQMETFPDTFSFNTMLEASTNGINSIRNSSRTQRRYQTNYLQLNMNRTTAIDTIILRRANDLVIPELERIGALGFGNEVRYSPLSIRRRNEIQTARRNSNDIPSRILPYETNQNFCNQLY